MARHAAVSGAARAAISCVALVLGLPAAARAQTSGAVEGRVRDAETGRGVAGALVTVDDGRRGAVTDTAGLYRIREVRSGVYTVDVRLIGYAPARRDSVTVRAGESSRADFLLSRRVVELPGVVVTAPDPVLDPLATATEQKVTAADLRALPVSSLEEAIALQAGAVGTSYRGGRLGQESFIIDGLGVKNQLDASTGGLGVRVPPDMLTEASLVTNGFSARYGQALSGMINVVTKDGGERWSGRTAYETDRPFPGTWDHGLDRVIASADGPLGPARVVATLDATGRLDADPVNAPAPLDPRDPRSQRPGILPHNGGEQYGAGLKVTLPLGRETVRLFGLRSSDQRLLFDPAFKYDTAPGPAQRVAGTLLTAQFQHVSSPTARIPLVADLRLGYFDRDFVRGTLARAPEPVFGAFTLRPFHVVGEGIARAQDTVAATRPIPGLKYPEESTLTPWGVGAFFLADGSSHGEVSWNRFRELRSQLDLTIGAGPQADLYVGGEVVQQRAQTFQRALGYLAVGDTVPPASAATFSPLALGLYTETQLRLADLGFTVGLRYDQFDARSDLRGRAGGTHRQLNPRLGVSTVLEGAVVVASVGSFSQPPDYQYLVDAAFDDTTRTGRFRQGNPALGYEQSWQYELSVRRRISPRSSFKVNVFMKRLDGLVASVPFGANPDSAIFGNADAGTVRGAEFLFTREMMDGVGIRVAYTLQQALAHSTSAFLRHEYFRIDPLTHDTIIPARVEFPLDYDRRHSVTLIVQGRVPAERRGPFAGLEAAAIGRYASGLPYTPVRTSYDSLFHFPNSARLPAVVSVDALVRRPLRLFGAGGSVYLDARNLLNRRNVVAVRRESGSPMLADRSIEAMAEAAYQADGTGRGAPPPPIPYESPRYRIEADLNGDGFIAGREELFPLYLAAARDYAQPIFYYGPPRLMRVGVEIRF